MTVTLNASTSSGFVMTPDNSGVITLQNAGTTGLTLDASGRPLTPLRPSFFAVRDSTNVSSNSDIVFQNTQNNIGSCYSTSTGRFTAPVTGLYSFTWSALSGTNSTVYRFTLYRNGNVISIGGNIDSCQIRLDCGTGIDYLQGTKTVNLYLTAGDYITVLYTSDDSSAIQAPAWLYFTGFLIG
jgi:hypothetical protein